MCATRCSSCAQIAVAHGRRVNVGEFCKNSFAKRRHRRDKPGRAFENVYYTFDILGNLGLYRDLHRHRILTQERQEFTTVHGYDTPQEIDDAGFKVDFDQCMAEAAGLYENIFRDFPSKHSTSCPSRTRSAGT